MYEHMNKIKIEKFLVSENDFGDFFFQLKGANLIRKR